MRRPVAAAALGRILGQAALGVVEAALAAAAARSASPAAAHLEVATAAVVSTLALASTSNWCSWRVRAASTSACSPTSSRATSGFELG